MANAKGTKTELAAQNTREISVAERFNNDTLREVKNVDDAMALLIGAYGDVQSIDDFEMGSGFKLLDDKDKARLVGVPFIVLHYQFNEGDFGRDFASVTLITTDKNQDRLILNDGGTGICDQLRDIAARTGRYGGFSVPNGLRASEYETCVGCGKPRKATQTTCPTAGCTDLGDKRGKGATYYLDVNG